MKSTFLSEMNSRGFLNQCTDLEGLKKIFNQKNVFKGKTGIFEIKDNRINHQLNLHQLLNDFY